MATSTTKRKLTSAVTGTTYDVAAAAAARCFNCGYRHDQSRECLSMRYATVVNYW